ncbi:MAG: response regulator [Kofleriaceae bacterium]
MLIVEEDIQQAALLSERLTEAGVVATIATTSAEAIARITARCPDAVLLDVTFELSARTGVGLVAMVRVIAPELPMVVMSGFDVALAIEIQSIGVGYIEKPIEVELLKDILAEQLAVRKTA